MDLEGAFFDLKGALLHSLPKSGGAMAPLAPSVPTSLSVTHNTKRLKRIGSSAFASHSTSYYKNTTLISTNCYHMYLSTKIAVLQQGQFNCCCHQMGRRRGSAPPALEQ